MKIKCMLDKFEYETKPQGVEIGKITNRLYTSQVEIEIEELANSLVKGCTFKPSLLNGKKESDWMEQNLYALDFDENTTIETELNRCKELNILPCFVYTSFSHTQEHHKFRLVFCTNEVINYYDTAKELQLTLMNIFDNCDEKCKNLSRLYFGGKELIYTNFDSRIDYEKILDKYKIETIESISSREIKEVKIDKVPLINNISSNHTIQYLSGGTSPIQENTKEKYYNIKAIRERNVEYLKEKLNLPKVTVTNGREFSDYVCSYNLGKLLEFKYPSSIKCIFHNDNNPSAGIFKTDDGHYIYNCFGCGVKYNIINVIERLGKFKSRRKTLKFIQEVFNVEYIESEWQKEQKEVLQDNIDFILSGEFESLCPTTYKNIKNNIEFLLKLHNIAKNNVYHENLTDSEDNIAFFASNKFLCKEMGLSENSSKEISKKNVLLQYHGLINKLSDEEIPLEMLKRSQAININKQNKKEKRINVFSIPSYNTELFVDVENQGEQWKDNGYTMKGLSREMFYRTEGEEITNKLYPQYKEVYDNNEKAIVKRTTSDLSNLRTDKIVEYLFDVLNSQGYVTERYLIDELSSDGELNTTKSEAEKQVKKSIKEIMDSYGLKKIKCNKSVKEKYKVSESGYPYIIVREE
jgi:hypothetical protein